MKTHGLFITFCLSLVLLANACGPTTPQQMAKPELPATFPKTTLDCIFMETVYDWKALDAVGVRWPADRGVDSRAAGSTTADNRVVSAGIGVDGRSPSEGHLLE